MPFPPSVRGRQRILCKTNTWPRTSAKSRPNSKPPSATGMTSSFASGTSVFLIPFLALLFVAISIEVNPPRLGLRHVRDAAPYDTAPRHDGQCRARAASSIPPVSPLRMTSLRWRTSKAVWALMMNRPWDVISKVCWRRMRGGVGTREL
jgi:hypothetical protein